MKRYPILASESDYSDYVETAAFGCLARAKLGRSTMNPDSCCLLLQINMLDVLNWKSEKPLSEPLKFFGRVRREEL